MSRFGTAAIAARIIITFIFFVGLFGNSSSANLLDPATEAAAQRARDRRLQTLVNRQRERRNLDNEYFEGMDYTSDPEKQLQQIEEISKKAFGFQLSEAELSDLREMKENDKKAFGQVYSNYQDEFQKWRREIRGLEGLERYKFKTPFKDGVI